jgi:hypothetical protein
MTPEEIEHAAMFGRCGAPYPGGRGRCTQAIGHEFGDYADRIDGAPHCFYEMGWPIEWTDGSGSPWSEDVRRAAAAWREENRP